MARCVRTIDVARMIKSLVGREDIEQVDPIAEPVAIDRHRRRGNDPQVIAQVRLVLVRRRGHPHLEDGLRHRFGIAELGLVLDAKQHGFPISIPRDCPVPQAIGRRGDGSTAHVRK